MDNKYQTLQIIFDLVKNDARPTKTVVYPNEIIVRQQFAWHDIVTHLNELKAAHLINILQHSPAVILITEAGVQYILSLKSKTGNVLYAA